MAGKTENILKSLFFFGRPLSPLYSFIMTTRGSFYRKGLMKQHRLKVPVVSVGNLVLGGTGKTPLVQYIARLLQQQGGKPAVLSRGYKGSATGSINVVSNPDAILLEASEAGDEPRLLAEKLPGIPVITGKKRFLTGRFAIDSFGADILILDDGFQHLALQRDLDLVLFNASKGLGNGHVLPGGELRESLSGLKRADAFIISNVDTPQKDNVPEFISFLKARFPEIPLFTSSYQPENVLLRIDNAKNATISHEVAGKIPLYGFCGIAVPASFKMTLEKNGMKLKGFQNFPDHHDYSTSDIRSLLDDARTSGAEGLITTEKDWVKLRSLFPQEMPLLVQPVQLCFSENFNRFLMGHLATFPNPRV